MKLSIVLFFIFTSLSTAYSHSGRKTAAKKKNTLKVTSQKIAGCVHMIKGMGGNIGVCSSKERLVLIDTQFEKVSKKVNRVLRKISKRKIDFIVNTHWHGDHTNGNKFFGKSSHIVAHENVRKRLSEDQVSEFLQKTTKALPPKALPIITFKSELVLHIGDEEVQIKHLPSGHTDGDSVVFFRNSKVVHVGDHFFKNKFPYIDLGAGGSITGFKNNIKKLLEIIPKNYKIIPGHGELANYSDLEKFYTMLNETIDRIKGLKNLEKSLETIQKMTLFESYEGWGNGFISKEKWITTIFNGLK
ncbi:MAG: MBL fold metallo-hydrolase [Bacteriovoracaceae bacterium]|nr:MBL fold metallo-hydrolase [Bacteriovoracaceae bacterium]